MKLQLLEINALAEKKMLQMLWILMTELRPFFQGQTIAKETQYIKSILSVWLLCKRTEDTNLC